MNTDIAWQLSVVNATLKEGRSIDPNKHKATLKQVNESMGLLGELQRKLELAVKRQSVVAGFTPKRIIENDPSLYIAEGFMELDGVDEECLLTHCIPQNDIRIKFRHEEGERFYDCLFQGFKKQPQSLKWRR